MSWGPAVLATAVALALINVGIASVIVVAIGAQTFVPLWMGALAFVLGALAAFGAWKLWRQYLAAPRDF